MFAEFLKALSVCIIITLVLGLGFVINVIYFSTDNNIAFANFEIPANQDSINSSNKQTDLSTQEQLSEILELNDTNILFDKDQIIKKEKNLEKELPGQAFPNNLFNLYSIWLGLDQLIKNFKYIYAKKQEQQIKKLETIKESEKFTTKNPEVSINNQLKAEVEKILGPDLPKYSFYYHNLKTGEKFEINGNTPRPPASISKVPSAVLTMNSIENNEFNWNTTIALNSALKSIPQDPMYAYQNGVRYNIKEYIYNVIVGSDNTAMQHLEFLHGGIDVYKQKLNDRLGIKLVRQPHQVLAREVGYVFEGIYNQSFLNKENNDYLISLLSNNHRWNSDRLVLAMKPYSGVKVVHKIGQIPTDKGSTYHDAGIIYGPKQDFVLVVLNQDTTPSLGITRIIDVARYIYEKTNL